MKLLSSIYRICSIFSLFLPSAGTRSLQSKLAVQVSKITLNHVEILSRRRTSRSCCNTEQIKKLQKNGSVEHEISIFWVPRRTLVSNKILEDEGILGDVNVSEFPMHFLPLEDDLLSLELGDAFMELYLVSLRSRFCSVVLTCLRKETLRQYFLHPKH
jgi:Sec1 family